MDKELTPIQMAILELLKVSNLTHLDKEKTINLLRQLIPTERKFAEGLFDAGMSRIASIYRDDYLKSPTFDTLYKKYENE